MKNTMPTEGLDWLADRTAATKDLANLYSATTLYGDKLAATYAAACAKITSLTANTSSTYTVVPSHYTSDEFVEKFLWGVPLKEIQEIIRNHYIELTI